MEATTQVNTDRVTPGQLRRAFRHFDFQSFLENAGLDAKERNGEISSECPYCHHRRTSFYVKAGVGVFTCHYCQESGWGIKLIEYVARCTTSEAIERVMSSRVGIYDDADYEIVEEDKEEEPPPTVELPPGFHLLADSHGETAKPYRAYALSRMTEKQMVEYKVGFTAIDYYRGRIVVPVYYLGALVNWVARSIRDSKKKVLTPPCNDQYSYLYNLEKVWGREQVVITEGVFDCLALDDMAVATFGKKVTDTQVNALVNAGVKELVLAWDSDAQKEIWDTYQRLRATFDRVTAVELPQGEDPSGVGRAGMVQYVKEARTPQPPEKVTGGVPELEKVRL